MKPWRRITGWLALLGVILYGLTPAFACLVPRAVPVACATAAVHRCSCKPDPHRVTACCCSHQSDAPDCSMKRLPCDGAPVELARTVVTNPLFVAPSGLAMLPLRRELVVIIGVVPAPRAVPGDPRVPPPRPQSVIS